VTDGQTGVLTAALAAGAQAQPVARRGGVEDRDDVEAVLAGVHAEQRVEQVEVEQRLVAAAAQRLDPGGRRDVHGERAVRERRADDAVTEPVAQQRLGLLRGERS
jgi:hypothetical protein